MSDPVVVCLGCGKTSESSVWSDLGCCPYCGYGRSRAEADLDSGKGWDRFLELARRAGLRFE